MLRLSFFLAALLALAALGPARAQRPTDLWYFGQQAGLSFANGAPTPLTNGAMTTYEGCATATTRRGELLFYTDGQTVWNRLHQPMPSGRHLMGSGSSTQSALIVPDPGSGNIFYIFTVGPQGNTDGLRYSVVDMTRANGLGDVPRANLLLVTPVAEKLAAVRHPNGRDVWVLAHRWNSNAFVAYLVTADGVSAKPVMSNVGATNAGPGRNAIGALKFSPDGTKLYGTANGNTSAKNVATAGSETQVLQFDLATKKATPIGHSTNHKIGALQRGPDGRIYVAREDNSFLGVIENPNAAGPAARYTDDGLNLGGRRSKLGLPEFIVEP